MPAIPLPFEGGGVRKWQSYVQVLHMIGDPPRWALYQPSSLSSSEKATQEEAAFDVKWLRGVYSAELWGEKQHENNNPLNSD